MYVKGGRAVYPPMFGKSVGLILLDDVACVGNESSLSECPQLTAGAHDCTHGEDAGAICNTAEKCQWSISASVPVAMRRQLNYNACILTEI